MAQVVMAVGSSHGPTVQSPPEKWAKLGEGDKLDPRFDYQGFLKVAPPGLDKQITPEMQQKRDAAKTVALGKLTQIIKDANCDVIVVVSNIHRVEKTGHHPIFGVMRAPSFPVAKMSERLFDPEARKHKFDEEKDNYHVRNPDSERPGHPALATWLVNGDRGRLRCRHARQFRAGRDARRRLCLCRQMAVRQHANSDRAVHHQP